MDSVIEKKKRNFSIQAPDPSNAQINGREEVRKYLRLVPNAADPNLGRVREIKEEIKNGTYLSREVIEEAAMQLAIRLLRKNSD